MSDSFVNAVAGSGAPIDAEQVTTGAGAVYRQMVGLGDPATGGNRAAINSAGGLAIARYNGASWDPSYNANQAVPLLPPAARTATVNTPVVGYNWSGWLFAVNVTAYTAGGSLQFAIYDATVTAAILVATATIVGTGYYMYLVSDASTTTGPAGSQIQQLFQIPLPGQCRLALLAGNANSITYSVTGYPIVRA